MQEYDCLTCGACCTTVTNKVVVFKVEFDDSKFSHGKHIKQFTLPDGENYKMKFSIEGKCIALDGQIGKCVSCTIYENRPLVCRTFEAGGTNCKNSRRKLLNLN